VKFSYSSYSYSFKNPLVTSHGVWRTREGIIVTLQDSTGSIGQGEIAPLQWFGTETLEDALAFCQKLPEEITEDTVTQIPAFLPCCQFAFDSALFHLSHSPVDESKHEFCYTRLLSAGESALDQLSENIMTYKWKIGVYPCQDEQNIFLDLVKSLSPGCKLRLDANGGMTLQQTKKWLSLMENYQQAVEYLEQPLPTQELEEMLKLSKDYVIPIALDESVAGLGQIEDCYIKGWRGIYVIKPAIAGSVFKLSKICLGLDIDIVVSTVFETQIGRSMSLYLAQKLANPQRALGYPNP